MSKRKQRRAAAPAREPDKGAQPAAAEPSAGAAEPAAAPAEELGFSESTAHWLARGDEASTGGLGDEHAAVRFDGRGSTNRRDLAILGGAALLALSLVWILHGRAAQPGHRPAPGAPAAAASSAPSGVAR